MNEEQFFIELAQKTDAAPDAATRAPARFKARLYSTLVAAMQTRGQLRTLPATKSAGRDLCVFENLLQLVPSDQVTSMNPCRVCHARVLAERFESPPIYWPHCPYVEFKRE